MLTAEIVGSGAGRQRDAFSSDHGGRQISVNMDIKLLHLDDESLICRIQEGSHEAFATLVDRHSNRFYRIAYRLVAGKDDAEDIVQEAFLKLWDRPNLWDPGKRAKFTTWFYRVVINLCFDHRKKKKMISLPADIEFADENSGPDVLFDVHQKQAVLERFIQELPERQQLAVNLCFYEELSNNEAAQIIGVKVKALQSLVMRAKTTLKYKVKRYLGGGSRCQ
ncbi:MAG: sigma-70 family RNA polymerase sigma factor [Desulfobacterales bacterium]|uniref:Sigma-70 family RNA polymerase sigma factor n=1 Tax=Candidatus Desulfatibia vada TaxID=2841696 RepID=A0A8J6TQ25_9BACT|nr:sigma-70 family RNA polymerase sigma factor [Candidatus Desulfatibia vada]MBL6971763.1 sigma-70 family RNA polymerase sigma factor [Desulfobacterales bacterium]